MPEYKSNKIGRPIVKIVLGSFPKYVVMLSECNPIKNKVLFSQDSENKFP